MARISAESGKGSSFCFYLEFEYLEETSIEKEIDIDFSDTPVLVVDDIKEQRDLAVAILTQLGYLAEAVSSGEEALAYLQRQRVDLVVLDMIMDPGINGRETYERIKKINPSQKAVIVSGFAETDEVKETQKLGAGQYIKKPLTLESLGPVIKEELEQ